MEIVRERLLAGAATSVEWPTRIQRGGRVGQPALPPRATAEPALSTRTARFVVLALLLACTLGARLPGAVGDALWQDEVGAERAALQSTLQSSIRQIVGHESTPPAYYLLARTVDRTTSRVTLEHRVQILHAMSILLSLVVTAGTFLLAGRFLPLWAAALAGLVVSFAGVLVAHGSELRSYPLLAAAAVVLALALEAAAERATPWRLLALGAVVALGSLTHYFFLLTVAAGLLWLLVGGLDRRTAVRVVTAIGIGLVPLVAWTPAWVFQYRHGAYATSPPISSGRFLEVTVSQLAPQALVLDTPRVLQALATVAILAAAALLLRDRGGRLVGLLVLVPLLAAGLAAWATGDRIFNTRNLIAIAPFCAIALAGACSRVPWRAAGISIAAALALAVIAGFAYGQVELGRTPYDRIAADMRTQGYTRDDPILWLGGFGGIGPVAWYLGTDMPASHWPRYRLAAPTGAPCAAVAVVARNATGRRWLRQHAANVLAASAVPSYGDGPEGKRLTDIVVARVSWFPGVLKQPDRGHARFRFRRADGNPPCLVP